MPESIKIPGTDIELPLWAVAGIVVAVLGLVYLAKSGGSAAAALSPDTQVLPPVASVVSSGAKGNGYGSGSYIPHSSVGDEATTVGSIPAAPLPVPPTDIGGASIGGGSRFYVPNNGIPYVGSTTGPAIMPSTPIAASGPRYVLGQGQNGASYIRDTVAGGTFSPFGAPADVLRSLGISQAGVDYYGGV